MKILHVGLCVDGKNEGLPFALKEVSEDYNEYPTSEPNLNEVIKNRAGWYKPDLVFFQLQEANKVFPDTFKYLKDRNIFTVNWMGDIRNQTERWFFETGADLTLFSNMRDVEALRRQGLKADFLQIGIDPKVYNKHESHEQGNDVVYMGNNYRNQFPEGQNRANMIQFLQSGYRNRFSLYGNGWPGATGENNADQLKQSKIYNNSKIGINFSQFNVDRYTSDRMFRILGSGCFCLSHHYKGIEKDFKIGEHLDTFRNFAELKVKIDHYLADENERKRIAENGYRYCQENHTYKAMVKNLLELVNKYR